MYLLYSYGHLFLLVFLALSNEQNWNPLICILTKCSWFRHLPQTGASRPISVLHTSHHIAMRCHITAQSSVPGSNSCVTVGKQNQWMR